MTRPIVERPAHDTLYLTDATGTRWRVYDGELRAGRIHLQALGSAAATTRIFVRADGVERSVTLLPAARARALTADHLTRQLRDALGAPR